MDITTIGKFSNRDKNAVLRIARLVMEMASADEFYELTIDSETGIVAIQKWKRDGDELAIVCKVIWKPGIYRSDKRYTALKDIRKWLEAEKAVHIEANLSLGREERGE